MFVTTAAQGNYGGGEKNGCLVVPFLPLLTLKETRNVQLGSVAVLPSSSSVSWSMYSSIVLYSIYMHNDLVLSCAGHIRSSTQQISRTVYITFSPVLLYSFVQPCVTTVTAGVVRPFSLSNNWVHFPTCRVLNIH